MNHNCTMTVKCTDGLISVNEGYSCDANAVCEKRSGERKCDFTRGYQGNGQTCKQITDCLDLFNEDVTTEGLHPIKPIKWNTSPFDVFCDMTHGGGWTVSLVYAYINQSYLSISGFMCIY